MRTELRRKERAIKTSREMELLLERMPVGRLAVTTEEGPYIVAVNYLFFKGSIYFHLCFLPYKRPEHQEDRCRKDCHRVHER